MMMRSVNVTPSDSAHGSVAGVAEVPAWGPVEPHEKATGNALPAASEK